MPEDVSNLPVAKGALSGVWLASYIPLHEEGEDAVNTEKEALEFRISLVIRWNADFAMPVIKGL